MISVSQDCYTELQKRTDLLEYATLTLQDGTVFNLTPADFSITNNSISDGSGLTTFPIGVAVEKIIQVELTNPADRYNSYNFYGATIELSLMYQMTNSAQLFSRGTYTVIEPAIYGDTLILSAADDMHKADIQIGSLINEDETIQFPISLRDLTAHVCDVLNFIPSSLTFRNSNMTVSGISGDLSDYTYRELIAFIAQLAGANARINYDNVLEFISYDQNKLDTMASSITEDTDVLADGSFPMTLSFPEDPSTFQDMSITLSDANEDTVHQWTWAQLQLLIDNGTITLPNNSDIDNLTDTPAHMEVKWLSSYSGTWHSYKMLLPNVNGNIQYGVLNKWKSITIDIDDVEITGLEMILSGDQLLSDDVEQTASVGTTDYVLSLASNPFVNSENVTTILNSIGEVIIGCKFRPFTGEHISNPLIEFMDPVFIVNKNGKIFTSIITDIDYRVLGCTNFKNSAESKLQNEKAYKSKTRESFLNAIQIVDKKTEAIRNYFWHDAGGAHVSTVENDATTGPNTLIDSTGMAVREDETEVARFSGTEIDLGTNSQNSVIKMCADKGEISVDTARSVPTLSITSKEAVGPVLTGSAIMLEAQCSSNTWDRVAHIVVESTQHTSDGSGQQGYINLRARGGGVHFDQSPIDAYGSSLLFGDGEEQTDISNFATFLKYTPFNNITGWEDSLTDADNAPKMNFTRLNNNHGVANVPIANACWLLTLGSNDNNKIQFCTAANVSAFDLYMRKCSSGLWGEWKSKTFS